MLSRIDPRSGRALPTGIRYRADRDRYQVRVRVKGSDGTWRERSMFLFTLAEAERRRSLLRHEFDSSGEIPLERWHERYWPVIEATIRPASARAYDAAWRVRVRPSLGQFPISSNTSPAIEMAMLEWSGALSTKKDALALLSRLLDGARRARMIDVNPVVDVRVPRVLPSSSLRSRALSVEQVDQLLLMIPDGPYRSFVAGLAYTGMRAGEATAMRVGDTDFDAQVIRVCRSISPGRNGELVEQAPKGYRDRHVPLCDALLPYVQEAARGKQPLNRLFTGPRGGSLTSRLLARAIDWPGIRRTLGRPDLMIRDLRHTFATMLFDAGVSAPDVQQAMGHSSLQVTERYSRPRDGSAARSAVKLNDFLGGTSASSTRFFKRSQPSGKRKRSANQPH